MDDVIDRLRKVLVETLNLKMDPADVPEKGLVNALGLDSINTVEYLIWVENEFGIEIDDQDLSISLIDDLTLLADYVRSKQAATVPTPAS